MEISDLRKDEGDWFNIGGNKDKYNVFTSLQRDRHLLLKHKAGEKSGRKMKIQHGFVWTEKLLVNYPTVKLFYDTNLHHSRQILQQCYGINEMYATTGENLMINHHRVIEQYVHCDFHDPRRES